MSKLDSATVVELDSFRPGQEKGSRYNREELTLGQLVFCLLIIVPVGGFLYWISDAVKEIDG